LLAVQLASNDGSKSAFRSFTLDGTYESPTTTLGQAGQFRGVAAAVAIDHASVLAVETLGDGVGYGTAWASRHENVFAVDGTGGDDAITLSADNNTIGATVNGTASTAARATHGRVSVSGGAGVDTIDGASLTIPMIAAGGDGADSVTTGAGDDSVTGGAGADVVSLGVGADYVLGGDDNDTLNGGGGSDTISAGAGRNALFGGDGNDRLNGSGGRDALNGDNGDDRLYGFGGSDTLGGGVGIDRLFAGLGDDALGGNGSNDKLYGEAGRDTLNGGSGADILDGGSDEDTAGNDGSDTLVNVP